MAVYRENIIATAEKYLGCNEADGSHKKIIDRYNAHKPLARGYKVKYKDAWCATFVSAVAIECGATDIIPTECGCDNQIALFKKIGSWEERDNYIPKGGEVIYYDWQDSGKGDNRGDVEHVGIVQKVVGSTIYVIEGNYNNKVGIRTISVNGKCIRGYGIPKYATKPLAQSKSVETVAREVINGKWGNGEAREAKLKAAGYNYEAIQKKVNELLKNNNNVIKVGSSVKVKNNAKTYFGKPLKDFVYNRVHKVHSMYGDRVVITYNGVVVAAVNKKDLIKV